MTGTLSLFFFVPRKKCPASLCPAAGSVAYCGFRLVVAVSSAAPIVAVADTLVPISTTPLPAYRPMPAMAFVEAFLLSAFTSTSNASAPVMEAMSTGALNVA